MADDGFNGSTLAFADVDVGIIRSVSFSQDGNPVDVTVISDTWHNFVLGLTSLECTLGVIGGSALALGATGTIAIVWSDGQLDGEGATFVITALDTSGDLDGEIATNYTFQPYGGA